MDIQNKDFIDMTKASSGGGGGTSDYSDLSNKPKINNVTLIGNKTSSDLGLVSTTDKATTQALGLVKPDGTTITIDADGVISSSGGGSVDDVQINGTSIVSSGVANIPIANTSRLGTIKGSFTYGSIVNALGELYGSTVSAANFTSYNNSGLISKATLENIVTGIPITITDSSTTALTKNRIYTTAEATALTVTYPATPDNSFIAELDFTSGTTPTTLTLPSGTKCIGDDCTGGTFTPVASKRYTCLFYYDGVNFRCLVSGVA